MTTETGATTLVPHRPTRALLCCAAALLCAIAWACLVITHPHLEAYSDDYDAFFEGGMVAVSLCFALAGTFLLVNRAARGLGWALLVTGLTMEIAELAGLAGMLAGPTGRVADLLVLTGLAAWICYSVTVLLFPLWLPDGRLPRGPAGRALVVLFAACGVMYGFVAVAKDETWNTLDNPLHHGVWAGLYRRYAEVFGEADGSANLGQHTFTALVALGLLVAVVRWFRSPGPHRRLVELLGPYLVWMAAVIVPYYTDYVGGWLVTIVYLAGALAWTVGLTVAFRRDRSLSLDRETRRRLSLCLFLAVLFALALGLAYTVHQLLPAEDRTAVARWWVLVGAVLFGVLLRPLFGAVSHAVDRYYYGERAHPYQVARALAEQLSRAVDPARTPPLLCETTVHSLGLPAAAVRVAGAEGERQLAALGALGPSAERFPLHYEGAEIGALLAAPRTGQTGLDRQDRDVLQLLADQSAPALASLRLYEDLQAGRKRLVLAREEERRRLRHDLHDGLGPALSGLRLRLDAAGAGEAHSSAAGIALTAASDEIGQLIVELRRITDGLAPAALGTEGLTGALRRLADGLAGRNLAVTLDLSPDPLPPLPAAVEVAVYRISGEALNNVVRHSGASSVRLELRVCEDEVTVEARDNGAGFPHHLDRVGVGLRSMAERAEELGGYFTAANDTQGARVRAVLPRTGPAGIPE